jgi:hypothetical protein
MAATFCGNQGIKQSHVHLVPLVQCRAAIRLAELGPQRFTAGLQEQQEKTHNLLLSGQTPSQTDV